MRMLTQADEKDAGFHSNQVWHNTIDIYRQSESYHLLRLHLSWNPIRSLEYICGGTNCRCLPHTVHLRTLQRNILVRIHGKTSIVIRGYISTGWMSFSFTWEPNLWSNSEVEITEKVEAQLSVWFRWDDMDGTRNTQGGTALEVSL